MNKFVPIAGMAVAALLATSACGGSTPAEQSTAKPGGGTVVVGSANFPEDVLLADIYAEALKSKGFDVDTKLNIGSREVYFAAMKKGQISVLPEYNGTLLSYLDKSANPASSAAATKALNAKLPASLHALNSSKAEDKDSLTVTEQTASKYHLTSIADLKPVQDKITVGGPPEFKTRETGMVGLKEKYGLDFKGFKSLDTGGPITVSALKKGQIQAADLFTTDPAITTNHFVVLSDPKHVFGFAAVTPVINTKQVNSKAQGVLNGISAKLTTPGLMSMMKKVSLEKKDAKDVAKQWLSSNGLS